jgi:hypothetical protein
MIWVSQDDNQIIQHYNSTIIGLFNYYSGAQKRSRLGIIWYVLKFSCAFTMALRHRTFFKKIFTKHGSSLKVIYGMKGEKVIKLYKPGLKEKEQKWLPGRQLPDPYRYIARRLSKSKIDEKCCICDDTTVHMHHVKHLKDAKPYTVRGIMSALNRKQISVCKKCHIKIHNGSYDGIKLSEFANPDIAAR